MESGCAIVAQAPAPVPQDNERMSISRDTLRQALDALLQPERFKDYGPNGLQVEDRGEITRIVSGVTASRALIDAAIARAGRCRFCAPWAVLAWTGRAGHRLDEAAAAAAAGARHQPVCLSPAARRAHRTGQQRTTGARHWAG